MTTKAETYCEKCFMRRDSHRDEQHPFVEAFDTSSADSVFCPWCGADNGTDNGTDDFYEDCVIDCGDCERGFEITVTHSLSYDTDKVTCFACKSPIEKLLNHTMLGSRAFACSDSCHQKCNDAYLTYVTERQNFPQRGIGESGKWHRDQRPYT